MSKRLTIKDCMKRIDAIESRVAQLERKPMADVASISVDQHVSFTLHFSLPDDGGGFEQVVWERDGNEIARQDYAGLSYQIDDAPPSGDHHYGARLSRNGNVGEEVAGADVTV
jgi:hypothetical protein